MVRILMTAIALVMLAGCQTASKTSAVPLSSASGDDHKNTFLENAKCVTMLEVQIKIYEKMLQTLTNEKDRKQKTYFILLHNSQISFHLGAMKSLSTYGEVSEAEADVVIEKERQKRINSFVSNDHQHYSRFEADRVECKNLIRILDSEKVKTEI